MPGIGIGFKRDRMLEMENRDKSLTAAAAYKEVLGFLCLQDEADHARKSEELSRTGQDGIETNYQRVEQGR